MAGGGAGQSALTAVGGAWEIIQSRGWQVHVLPGGPRSGSLSLQTTMWQLCKEFFHFLREEKKWWLVPLVVILLLLAALIIFTGGSVLAPLMYPFM